MTTLNRLLLGLFLFVLSGAIAGAAEQSAYGELVAKLKSGDMSINFTALRYARAELADHDPYGSASGPARRDMFTALQADDLDKASTVATQIIEADYTDADAHMTLSIVLEQRGDADRSMFERAVAMGLFRSIIESGDGMTPETPFVVIAIAEEYLVLRQRGLRPERQALLQTQNGPVDALTGVDPANGMRQTLYFDVNRLFSALDR